ncbi:MAG TPA: glycosyltransferase [Mucilaginibacter sp.]|nr:glycosyltransferase [Mucilaginibacter sp.]
MKVLILHNDFRVYWKGRLTYLKKFLNSKNIEFYAIELFGKGSPYIFDRYDNVEKWWSCLFPEQSFSELSVNKLKNALFAKLDEINPDVVISGSIVFFSGALGIRWAKNHQKKFIMFDDAKPSQVKRNLLVQSIKDLITRQIDGIWLPTKDYDAEYTGLDKNNVVFFHGYNCINNEIFKFNSSREIVGKVIVCVARLVPIKNLDNLLRAWKLIETKNPDYKLVIIGDGPEFEHLNYLKTNLKLDRVVFLGAVNNTDIPTYFYNASAFILPSLSESWGLVVNEALAAGLPVLLSNKINARNSLLREGVNGFAFNPLSVSEMTDKINRYINLDLDTKMAMSKKSLEVIDEMSYENMGCELLTALDKIIHKKHKKLSFFAWLAINSWHGKYNTSGWDKLDKL